MFRRIVALVLVMLVCVGSAAYAGDHNALTKLGRGLANIGTSIIEVPKQTYLMAKNHPDPVTGSVFGFVKGLAYGVVRFGAGLADSLVCIIPPYDKPLMEPEFVFEGWE